MSEETAVVETDGAVVTLAADGWTLDPDVAKNLARVKLPEGGVDEEMVFGLLDEDLFAKVEQLREAGVDVGALLSELAAAEPERLMEHHRALSYSIARVREQVKREVERLEAWGERQNRGATRSLQHFESTLALIAFRLRETSRGKAKSLGTPAGTVQTRTVADSFDVGEESEELIALLERLAPQCVKTVKHVSMTELKKVAEVVEGRVVLRVGEKVFCELPGVEPKPGRVSYTITHEWPAKGGAA